LSIVEHLKSIFILGLSCTPQSFYVLFICAWESCSVVLFGFYDVGVMPMPQIRSWPFKQFSLVQQKLM